MKSIILELERRIFSYINNQDKHFILIVKELVNGEEKWRVLSKGAEYSHWYEIGERGGLAEAEELLVLKDGKAMSIKIEDYVALYRSEIKNAVPIEEAFNSFVIHVSAMRKIDCDDYIVKKIEETYAMDEVTKGVEHVYYFKEIKSIDELIKVNMDDYNDYTIKLEIVEK